MHSIEFIRLRTNSEKQLETMGWLLESVPTFRGLPCLKEAVICNGLSVPSDLSLLWRWDNIDLQACGSDAAMSITEGLSAFGLVNHTIWSVAGEAHL